MFYSWPTLVEVALLVALTNCILIKSAKEKFSYAFFLSMNEHRPWDIVILIECIKR